MQSPRVKSKKSVKKSKKNKKSLCKQRLSKKISINMKEMKNGRYKSPAQAIAVSYSQVLKEFPHCKRVLKKK
jgi:hypothetical protein